MKTYEVVGSVKIGFVYQIAAEDEEDAIDQACMKAHNECADASCVDVDEVNEE